MKLVDWTKPLAHISGPARLMGKLETTFRPYVCAVGEPDMATTVRVDAYGRWHEEDDPIIFNVPERNVFCIGLIKAKLACAGSEEYVRTFSKVTAIIRVCECEGKYEIELLENLNGNSA